MSCCKSNHTICIIIRMLSSTNLIYGLEDLKYSFSVGLIVGCAASATAFWLFTSNPQFIYATNTNHLDASDSEDFLIAGKGILNIIVHYRDNLANKLPVIPKVSPNYLTKALPHEAPTANESWSHIFADVDRLIIPGLTNWESNSKFFAYFKPHSSYPAVLGELLCAGLNVMGFDWIASPACTELEMVVLDWLAKFLNLPTKFLNMSRGPGGSVIQGSAGEAAIVAFLAAISKRRASLSYSPVNSTACSRDNMVVFSSDQAHAIVKKACMVLGIGHYHVISTSRENNFALSSDDLRDAIEEELAMGRVAVAVVATAGTTSSCAFDPIDAIAAICKEYSLWLHIDAAYGGAYACVPELQPLFEGLQNVDSLVVNCHKKLLCPFDIAALYVADREPVLQALSLQPEYLRNAASDSGAVVDYEHWQLPLGRRFRALKLWFVFRRYGTVKIRQHLERGLELSAYFSSLILGKESEDLFELVVPVSLSLVCFRLKGRSEDDQKRLLENIKATGDCFIIHTKLADKMVLRFACGGLEQSKEDVYNAFKLIMRVAREV